MHKQELNNCLCPSLMLKYAVVVFVLLLCYSLILIKCVGNELSKVARELADTQNELLRKLPGELLVKGQLKRNVRQDNEDTDLHF